MGSIPETTLSSPLLEAAYQQFFDEASKIKKNLRTEVGRLVNNLQLTDEAPPLSLIQRHVTENTPELSRLGTQTGMIPPATSERLLLDSAQFLETYLHSLRHGLEEQTDLDVPALGSFTCTDFMKSEITKASWKDTLYWINVMSNCIQASRTGGWLRMPGAWCSRRYAIVALKGKWILLIYDVVLMLKDMLYSRFLIHCLSTIDKDRLHLSTHLELFINWSNEVLTRFGNKGYNLIKGVEPLAKVRIILGVEKWLDAKKQAQDMVEKYTSREIELGGSGMFINRLWSLLMSLPTPAQQSEAFGFLKIVGHPYVNPRVGCARVQRLVQNPRPISFKAMQNIEASFCHVYTRGYLEKTGKWPPLEFHPNNRGQKTKLQLLYEEQKPVLAFGFTQYPRDDWLVTRFLPHQSFNRGDDVLELMSDRALSNLRSEFDAPWFGKLDYNPPKPSGSKRVLEQLLTKENLDLDAIVTRVQEEDIPFEWRIVSVSPKEREMKEEPRMFAKMVLEMRCFFVLAEKNLKEGVFKYLKEQTMTMSRQELLARFLSITAPRSDRWIRLVIEIDFDSWNLFFGPENCHPIGERLNEIYGEKKVYTTVHEFFKSCLIVLDDANYPPDGLSKETREAVLKGEMCLDTVYSDHDRGFEGIAQGEWTAVTIALGHAAVADLGVPFTQNGQGDNQVYTFDVYVPEDVDSEDISGYMEHLKDVILENLSSVAKSVGHSIKPDECIVSTCFFSYGKEMFADGQYLPSLCKFLSRIFPTTSSDAPSSYELVSSVASGATAATEKSNVSLPCLMLSKFVERLTIGREITNSLVHGRELFVHLNDLTGGNETMNRALTDLMAVIPGNLGGLPISTPLEFLYRGHSDPLSSSLACLHLLQSFPGVDEYLKCLDKGWMFKTEPDPTGLIMDPYSLPLARCSPPSTVVASAVRPVLLDKTRNVKFTGLLEHSSPEERAGMFQWLGSFTPPYPKAIHDLYKSSCIGLLDSFSRRFTNTRTLMTLARGSGIDLVNVSIHSDEVFFRETISRMILVTKVLRGDTGKVDSTQSYFTLKRWRQAWGLGDLLGVTNLHPVLSGRFLKMPEAWKRISSNNEIVVMSMIDNSSDCKELRGKSTPYLGSRTSDKAVGKWVSPVNTSPPFKDVITILKVQSLMTLPGSQAWYDLDRLAESRTTIPLDHLRSYVRVKYGGTNNHRYLTRDDPKGSFVNISINWPSHLTVSSNHAGDLGANDHPFDFQEAITLCQGVISWWGLNPILHAPFGLVLQVDLARMEPVGDHIMSAEKCSISYPSPSDSYYTTVTSVTLSSRALRSARFTPDSILRSLPLIDPSPLQALPVFLLQHLTGNIQVGSRFGSTLGDISYKKIIDLPEVNIIQVDEFKDALVRAIQDKLALPSALLCGYKTRMINQVFEKFLNTEVRRVIPSLYGTLRELGGSDFKGDGGMGLGHSGSVRGLVRWMTAVHHNALQIGGRTDCLLFTHGSASLSRSLLAFLGREAFLLCSNRERGYWSSGKEVARLAQIIGNWDSEIDKVRALLSLVRVLDLTRFIKVAHLSPEEVFRKLRNAPSRPAITHSPTYIAILEEGNAGLHGFIGRSTIISYKPVRLAPEELFQSWSGRTPSQLETAVRWSPLRSVVGNIQRVLLIGVGDGTIGPALDPNWDVVGIELGSVLANQGQSMVDYSPPYLCQKFRLHPLSWSSGGNVTTEFVQQALEVECKLHLYDLVIIDIEGVETIDRLRLRQRLAGHGVKSYCKVFVEPEDSPFLYASFLAYKSRADHIWCTPSYPTREIILGGSESPLGIFMAEAAVPTELAIPALERVSVEISYTQPWSIQEAVLEVTGDFVNLENTIPLARCKALRSYLNNDDVANMDTIRRLISSRAPRRRVRALFELIRAGIVV